MKHGDRLPLQQYSAPLLPPADRRTNGSASSRSLEPLQGIPARIEHQVGQIEVTPYRGAQHKNTIANTQHSWLSTSRQMIQWTANFLRGKTSASYFDLPQPHEPYTPIKNQGRSPIQVATSNEGRFMYNVLHVFAHLLCWLRVFSRGLGSGA